MRIQEIRKRLVDKEKRNKADKIISDNFYGFDGSICVKIIKEITHKNADDIQTWLHENCKGKFTYNNKWKTDRDNKWYLNFYFQSKKDAASFKIIWG